MTLRNDTNGQQPDSNIYVTIVGVDAPGGRVIYARPGSASGSGVIGDVSSGVATDNNTPAACVATAASCATTCDNAATPCYVNYAFTLAQLGPDKTLYLPENKPYYGGRIYISIGRPLLQRISPDARGLSQPNIENSSDPNYETPFDWFEFAYAPSNNVSFGGNVTQVDLYSVPLSFTVTGVNGTTMRRGITLGAGSSSGVATRDDLVARYLSSVGAPFQSLVQWNNGKAIRLIAPYHAANFLPNGADAAMFDGYVAAVWDKYFQVDGINNADRFEFLDQHGNAGNRYYYCEAADRRSGQLCFRYDSADQTVHSGPFYIAPPSSYDVLTNGGALQPGCASDPRYNECNAFGAQLAAALNRAVAHLPPAHWHDPTQFYRASPKNDWVQFWHSVSIDGRAYGMGFDDTADQSSVAILSPDENIRQLTIGIGW